MEAFVTRADNAQPTVPRWNANKFPLSNRVASEIVAFRGELRPRFEAGEPDEAMIAWISTRLACGRNNARIIHRMYAAQHRLSEIPTAEALLVEKFSPGTSPPPRRPPGRSAAAGVAPAPPTQPGPNGAALLLPLADWPSANDALSRVVALRLARLRGGNAVATPDDSGFVLTVAQTEPLGEADLRSLLEPPRWRSTSRRRSPGLNS